MRDNKKPDTLTDVYFLDEYKAFRTYVHSLSWWQRLFFIQPEQLPPEPNPHTFQLLHSYLNSRFSWIHQMIHPIYKAFSQTGEVKHCVQEKFEQTRPKMDKTISSTHSSSKTENSYNDSESTLVMFNLMGYDDSQNNKAATYDNTTSTSTAWMFNPFRYGCSKNDESQKELNERQKELDRYRKFTPLYRD